MLARLKAAGTPLWISRQVLREYLAAATRPQPSGLVLPMSQAISDVRRFQSGLNVLEDGADVFEHLLRLLAVHPGAGKQVHDANLVAVMLTHGIDQLCTFNVTDFRRFDKLINVVTP